MKKIFVILNQNAKKFRTHRSSAKKYANIKYEGLKLFFPCDMNELRSTINQIVQEKPDYICIGGGDGTIHIVLTELINAYKSIHIPPVLILKEGTMDNVARTIHLEGHGSAILERLISALTKNIDVPVFRRDTIKIGDRFCFIFGLGFITNFLKLVYSGGEKGTLRNALVGAKTFIEALLNTTKGEVFSNMNLHITADDKIIDINPVTGILSGTVEHIGMGFSPLIDASVVPGKFQTIVLGMEPRQVLFNISKIKHGEKIYEPGYANVHSSIMTIKHDTDFEYTMDGDIYIADRLLVIESGPSIDLIKI